MARDRITEITRLKDRANFRVPAQVQFFLLEIDAVWKRNENAGSDFVAPKQLWAGLSIVRTVTGLEVFIHAGGHDAGGLGPAR